MRHKFAEGTGSTLVHDDSANRWVIEYPDGGERTVTADEALGYAKDVAARGQTIHWGTKGTSKVEGKLSDLGFRP